MKKIIGICMLACLAIGVQAQMLWKVTGNGLEKPSYMFGTHHLAPLSVLDGIKGFQDAFDQSEMVVGELSLAEMMSPEVMGMMQEYMFMQGDTVIQDLMTPEEFEIVHKFVKDNLMIDLKIANKFKPAFISNTITVIVYTKHRPDFNPQEQLDMHILQRGVAANKKNEAFETMKYQLNVLFNSQPLKRQAEVLVCQLSDEEKMYKEVEELTNAYMAYDLDKLNQIAHQTTGTRCDALPEEMFALIDNRNINWAKRLPDMMKEQPTFVVVGALHLPGENGLINLLKKAGYSVEPVE